jgi:hypothetical protein
MASKNTRSAAISSLRGRTAQAARAPLDVPRDLAAEYLNCDRTEGSLAKKRQGAAAVTMGSAFTGILSALGRFVPGSDETAAQFVGVDADGVCARMSGGSTWSAVTLKDAIQSLYADVVFAVLNGKLFMTSNTAVDRMHILESGGTHRRAGLATPAAPTAANTGVGSYAATTRRYRVSYLVMSGSSILRQSELSSEVSFTPNGTGTAARVTKPSSISEDETHWRVWGAESGEPFHLLSTIAVGTTTYDDSTAPADYDGEAPPDEGANTNMVSAKVILSDGSRLLLAGSHESGGYNSRLWYTPVLGSSSGIGADDERIPNTTDQTNYIDVDENDGDSITGLAGPLFGSPYVFKYRSLHKLVATGVDTAPYERIPIKAPGAIRHQAIVIGEDAAGQPSMAWLSYNGAYRLGMEGLQYIGFDIEDIWETVNLAATTVVAHGLWHPERKQFWWWVATGSNNDPDTLIVFDPRYARLDVDTRQMRGGWFKFTGEAAKARCAVLFGKTLGASMSRALKPYIGQHGAVNRVWRCDDDSSTDDAGTSFQAYVETAYRGIGLDRNGRTTEPRLVADAASGVTVRVTAKSNFGALTDVTSDILLTAAGSETIVRKKAEGLQQDEIEFLAYRVGDSAAASNAWTLHALIDRTATEEML